MNRPERIKKYQVRLQGNGFERIFFMLFFTFLCLTIVLIPLAILALVQKIEIVESGQHGTLTDTDYH